MSKDTNPVIARGRYSGGLRFLCLFDTEADARRWAESVGATIDTIEDAPKRTVGHE